MAMPGESQREMREHPNPPSAPPMPATGRETQACSPHGCDPTVLKKDHLVSLVRVLKVGKVTGAAKPALLAMLVD